jgi:sphingolipid 4-desaturase/C4-monooxygenase
LEGEIESVGGKVVEMERKRGNWGGWEEKQRVGGKEGRMQGECRQGWEVEREECGVGEMAEDRSVQFLQLLSPVRVFPCPLSPDLVFIMAIQKKDSLNITDEQNHLQREKSMENEFVKATGPDPHMIRRKQLLKDHPEIETLYGHDVRQAYFCTVTVLLQVIMAYLVRDWSWGPLVIASYAISGTLNHSIFLAMHELSHDNFFPTRLQNQWFAMFANLPCGIAIASTFRRYHMIHHSSMGTETMDVDLPTAWEARFFDSILGRFTWLFLQPLFYAVRPLVFKPLPISFWEIVNWTVQLSFDAIIFYYFGYKSLSYLILGTLLGSGVHPLSGHFFEHLETVIGQETYSYYGPINSIVYNVGYHNEHHDFPRIPGSKLPELKRMVDAYDKLPHYNSWVELIIMFIFKGNVNLFCRVVRKLKD